MHNGEVVHRICGFISEKTLNGKYILSGSEDEKAILGNEYVTSVKAIVEDNRVCLSQRFFEG